MRGLLVRVGIDSSDEGHWNAPVDTRSWSFAYVPIVETKTFRRGLGTFYDELQTCLKKLGQRLPDHLVRRPMHIDPDFKFLTYGDTDARVEAEDEGILFTACLSGGPEVVAFLLSKGLNPWWLWGQIPANNIWIVRSVARFTAQTKPTYHCILDLAHLVMGEYGPAGRRSRTKAGTPAPPEAATTASGRHLTATSETAAPRRACRQI
jgi:hypothetical protein